MTVSAWFRGSGSPGNNRYLVAKGSNLCQTASYGLYTGPNGGMAFYVCDGADNGWTRSPEAGRRASGTASGTTRPARGTAASPAVHRRQGDRHRHARRRRRPNTAPRAATRRSAPTSAPATSTLTGDLDEVSIWSKALPVADIWKRAAVVLRSALRHDKLARPLGL